MGRDVATLKRIYYFDVEEVILYGESNDGLASEVYQMMKKPEGRSLTVSRTGTAEGEQDAFHKLLKQAPFCIGAQKMLDEYALVLGSDVKIDYFKFHSVAIGAFDFEIVLTS